MLDLPQIKSVSESAYEALVERITDFQRMLKDDEELGIVANGAGSVIHVETLTRSNQMFTVDGTDSEGRFSRLIVHYTQTNLHLLAVPKLEAEPRRIGF